MAASESIMGSAKGMEMGSSTGGLASGWASSSVLGLLAFGMTMIVFGLSNLPPPYGNGFNVGGNFWALYGLAFVFGGLASGLAGLIALKRGQLFWGTAFVSFGAFWIAYAITHYFVSGGVVNYGFAGFLFVWVLFSLTFLINSIKHGWITFLFFLFLFVGFVLLVVEYWQYGAGNTVSSGEMWAIAGELVVTGLIGWYAGTAELTNATYSKSLLPT